MEKIGDLLTKQSIMQTTNFRASFNAEKVYRCLEFNLQTILHPVNMILEGQNKFILGQLALWYSNDERFKGDLKKGILLRGGVGTGKTKIMKALVETVAIVENGKKIEMCDAIDLQNLFLRQNDEEIEKLEKRPWIIVDDIGKESTEIKYYGNVIEPFNQVFDARYRAGKSMIITTNETPEQLKMKYGDRIYDRFKETLNDLVLDGESLRK